MPTKDDVIEIGYFEMETGTWKKLTETRAFNWQQGSMLQWLGPDFNTRIIFNDVSEEGYIARILNISTNEQTTIPKAIYAITPDGKTSISLNFERCDFTRAYSYNVINDPKWNEPLPDFDGIIRIDLTTGLFETIIDIKTILSKFPVDISEKHWFEHIMLNLSGNKFSFYHRYGDKNEFSTRCFTADNNGGGIWLHPNKNTERLSHLGWVDDKQYVLYTITQSKISHKWITTSRNKSNPKWYVRFYRSFLKPFIPRKVIKVIPKPENYYALTQDGYGILDYINPLPKNMDGHPTFTRDKKFMLTDTYADDQGYRHLLIYSFRTKKTYSIGKFHSFYNNCGWRTDLHPRFSPNENQVIIDSNHTGKTSMIIINIDWKVII